MPLIRIDLPEDPLNDELNNFANGDNRMEVDDANHGSGGDEAVEAQFIDRCLVFQ